MEYESDMTTIYYDINGILLYIYIYIYICISLSLFIYCCFMTLRKSNIAMEHGYINHPKGSKWVMASMPSTTEYEATRPRGTGCSGNFLARPFIEDLPSGKLTVCY